MKEYEDFLLFDTFLLIKMQLSTLYVHKTFVSSHRLNLAELQWLYHS
jgi:hypothetical protein